ncbi:peptidase, M23 family [Paenibacillus algicola]|uniref:Peptidase, M23 family n=1 Tax=Paenibacillus algicola TaxID=2565926 RepID=A0A4P8XMM9_9BACL|nr:M23 family metallopeptidase [Paenibacillus algicola]QCT04066.1 peptidase, M23 family [Paenibacillus algicola]
MKRKPGKQPLTLLVLRDAQQSVRQIHFSKPLMILVPAAAVLSIAGLILTMHIQAERTVSGLERQLLLKNLEALRMEITVTDKDEAIERLNQAILQLSSEAAETEEQMQRVQELEAELRQFMKRHGYDPDNITSLESSGGMGGEYVAVHESEMLQLAEETRDDFERVRQLMSVMEQAIPRALDSAEQTRLKREATPSLWPTKSRTLTSSFGYRTDPINGRTAFHAGIDIAGDTGDPVYAAASGTVSAVERSAVRGRYVIVDHPDGLQTWYVHLDSAAVQAGDSITQGDVLGRLGSTGRSTGPHLHFEVVKNNRTVNPLEYVK